MFMHLPCDSHGWERDPVSTSQSVSWLTINFAFSPLSVQRVVAVILNLSLSQWREECCQVTSLRRPVRHTLTVQLWCALPCVRFVFPGSLLRNHNVWTVCPFPFHFFLFRQPTRQFVGTRIHNPPPPIKWSIVTFADVLKIKHIVHPLDFSSVSRLTFFILHHNHHNLRQNIMKLGVQQMGRFKECTSIGVADRWTTR